MVANLQKKKIPNTINIKFDPNSFDYNRINLLLFRLRIKNGNTLVEEEWAQFCGLSLFSEPGSEKLSLIKEKGFDKNNKKPLVRYYELQAKFHATDITIEEKIEFNELLKNRRVKRTEAIKYEIKRSTNKNIETFKKEYANIYEQIQKSIFQFETESLEYHEVITPIYWDYEGYLHIYLRHCDELAIEGHFENE